MITTTVIGLGAMGAGIAGNLHRAGMLAAAWNRTHERAERAGERHGFRPTPHLQAAVQCADLVITSVSADEDLLEMTRKIAPLLQAGNVVVDTSTVSIGAAQAAAEMYEAHGAHFLDAPVSGGKEGVEKGAMLMMVGGDEEVLRQVMPALQAISSKVVHMGPVGGGAAGNWFLDHRGKTMCEDRFEPGFRPALHHKDLRICRQILAADGKQLPMVEMTLSDYDTLLKQGHGDEDISTLFHTKKALLGDR